MEATGPKRVEVTAEFMADCDRKQRAYAAHRRQVAALYRADPEAPQGTPRPVLGGKIQDVRQERMAL